MLPVGAELQTPQSGAAAMAPAGAQDISGFWELSFDSRTVPAASLLPAVTRARIQARQKGEAYAIRWCNLLGMPFMMDSGRPLDIRQGQTAVIIVPENASAPRYLYLNRTAHVSEDIYDPSTNGDSIAHWEGDTLVVDTWDDPKVYQKPHVYRYYFERAPAVESAGAKISYALEEWCDAGDPVEKQSIVPPKQIKQQPR
jgi:hypothetical protein